MRSFTEGGGELHAVEAIRALNAKKIGRVSAERSFRGGAFGRAKCGDGGGCVRAKGGGAEHSGGQTVLFLLPARFNGDIISKDLS